MLDLQNKMSPNKINLKEISEARKKESKEIKGKKKDFLNDFDEAINITIKFLKTQLEWANLGDYYLALRYVWDMVDTGYFTEMNMEIGIQLMIYLTQLGNKYAYDSLKISINM